MTRNKEQTRESILSALARVVTRDGYAAAGINTVAREAGCDKVLIYRYFGGFDGLLKEFAARQRLIPDIDIASGGIVPGDASPANNDPRALSSSILIRLGQAMRSNPMTREILIWELQERNELTTTIAEEREKQGMRLLEAFPSLPSVDIAAISSILAAGITYLVIRGKTADVYNGVELNTDEGWKRIEKGIDDIVSSLFAHLPYTEK